MSDVAHPEIDPAILDAVDAFTGLAPEERAQVLEIAHRHRFAAEEDIFHQGDPAEAFFVLLRGHVRMTKLTPDGQQVTIRYIGPGETFGCVAACGGMSYPATATALEESMAAGWTRAQAQALAGRFPAVAFNVMRIMGGRLEEIQTRLSEVTYDRVERRIARAVTRLAAQAGRRTPEGVRIDVPLSRQDLAEYAGTTLATVSRTLSRWEDEGIVTLGRQRVVVRQPHGLVAIAEDLDAAS